MRSWFRTWGALSLAIALIATAADAVLLQQRRSYFTGGFLSVDHVTSAVQGLGFLLVSFAVDAAVLGAAAAVVLALCARIGISRGAAVVFAGVLVLAPVAAADFVEYQLLAYLGDAFDLQLMFDLTGRNPGEIIAVAWPQIARVASVGAVALAAAGASIWILRRRGARGARIARPSFRTIAAIVAVSVVSGGLVSLVARNSSDVLDNGLRRKPTGRFLGSAINLLSDVDRDGFGMLGRPPDSDLLDANVRPYALDVPGNGIDENGIGGDLPANVQPYEEPAIAKGSWRSMPDVVLIVLESFRADALGASVHGKRVTPVLDALAASGARSLRAYSHNGYTVQSRRHIFTGSAADLAGAGTLLDDFKANGYQTAYFSAQDESFGGQAQGVGFETADVSYDARHDADRRYSTFSTPGSLAVPHQVLQSRVSEFLAHGRNGKPLFLYVNFHDTHFPYHHAGIEPLVSTVVVPQSGIGPEDDARVREMYFNTAANVDAAIGALLHDAKAALGREPAVIVLSDHGESLFDEGFLGHGYALNDAQTRIPLIVSGLPLTIQEPFGQSDLRRLIDAAMSTDGARSVPAVHADPQKRVFQYLGNLASPAQIGFVTVHGRIVYDLRSRRARIGDGAWMREADLAADDRAVVLDLIQTWERMMLARSR